MLTGRIIGLPVIRQEWAISIRAAVGLCFRTCNLLLPKNTLCSFQEAVFREGMTQPHSRPPRTARWYVGPHATRCSNPALHPRSATAMSVPCAGIFPLENTVHRSFSVD